MENLLKEGTRILFNVRGVRGTAFIRGVVKSGICTQYIASLENGVLSEVYPYSSIAVLSDEILHVFED